MSTKHQKVRMLLQIFFTPILLVPEILIMLSPFLVFFLPSINKIAVYFSSAVLVLWLIVTILALFLGRAYCSHICPVTGLFNFISYLKNNRNILSFEYPKIMGKIILFFWFAAPLYVILRNVGNYTGFLPNEAIYSELAINLYYILFAISGILSNTYGKISVLHYTCPFASFMISAGRLGRKIGIPAFAFSYDKKLCKKCGACTKKCMNNRDIPKMLQSESINFEECVQCRYCSEKCKHGAIKYGWRKNYDGGLK